MSSSLRGRIRISWAVEATRSEYHRGSPAARVSACAPLWVRCSLRPTQGRALTKSAAALLALSRRTHVRSATRTILLAASFVLMLPVVALADTSAGWLSPRGGAVWPPAEYGTDDPLGPFRGIAGLRMT